MPSEPVSLPGRYLVGVLADGIRPFLYRSRVYRLLGAPPRAGTAIRFLPPLPPIGFRYERDRSLPERLQAVASMKTGAPFSRGVAAGETVSARDADTMRVQAQALVPAKTSSTDETLRNANQSEVGTRTEAMDTGRPREPLDGRAAGRLHAGLELPGVARRRSLLAALSAQRPGPQDAVPVDGHPSPTASAEKNARSSGGTGPPATPCRGPERKSGVPLRASAAPSIGSDETTHIGLEVPGITHQRSVFAALARQALARESAASAKRSDVEPTSIDAGRSRTEVPALARERHLEQCSAAATTFDHSDCTGPAGDIGGSGRVSTQAPRRDRGNLRRAAPIPPRRVDEEGGILSRSTSRAANEMKQLRQADTALALGQTAPRVERQETSPSESGSVPQQPLVVVQRAPVPVRRAPRAFWASSTLRSVHLRILR